MIRMQIMLTEAQYQSIKALAGARNISMAELIRQCVDQMMFSTQGLSLEERRERALSIVGKFSSGEPNANVSTEHDKYLADIYG